ncbi:MAG: hypothetical protein JSS30_00230 [Verrucomicrobia bacterium]|nr:hypothetical protein [Verrucomicrobiota bacterium]
MDSALMLAKVFGPSLAIIGLWMLLYTDNLQKILTAMKNSPAALYNSSVLNLVVGLFLITSYNGWRMDVFFFVTLLGWAFFIRALLGFFMPQVLVKFYYDRNKWTKVMGIVPLVWGLILIWAGFYK